MMLMVLRDLAFLPLPAEEEASFNDGQLDANLFGSVGCEDRVRERPSTTSSKQRRECSKKVVVRSRSTFSDESSEG